MAVDTIIGTEMNTIAVRDHSEYQYLELLHDVMSNGVERGDRTGVGTKSVFGRQIRFNLADGFPLITTKKVFWKGIVHELLWFLNGDTNIKYLNDHNVKIWNEWAHKNYVDATQINGQFEEDKWMRNNNDGTVSMYTLEQFVVKIKDDPEFAERWGDLGPVYGAQWRRLKEIVMIPDEDKIVVGIREHDQIANAIEVLRTNPDSRRIIVDSWNVPELGSMALTPCHCLFQFFSEPMDFGERTELFYQMYPEDRFTMFPTMFLDPIMGWNDFLDRKGIPGRTLSLQLYQRSADLGLGIPFNIASYALLLAMVAQVTNHVAKDFIHTFGDAHVYLNHFEGLNEQLTRQPHPFPTLRLNKGVKEIDDFLFEDITLEDYKSHPAIKLDIAV